MIWWNIHKQTSCVLNVETSTLCPKRKVTISNRYDITGYKQNFMIDIPLEPLYI